MMMLSLFGLLFGLMLIGVPVAVSLGTSTMITALLFTDMELMGVPQKVFDGLDHYSLMAIPMFILAGAFLSKEVPQTELLNLQSLS